MFHSVPEMIAQNIFSGAHARPHARTHTHSIRNLRDPSEVQKATLIYGTVTVVLLDFDLNNKTRNVRITQP